MVGQPAHSQRPRRAEDCPPYLSRWFVAGLMPHPDRASEAILGTTDGRLIFESMIAELEKKPAAKAA